MDENLPVNSGNHDSFDTAVRGYNRVQVQEYMARTNKALAALEQHLQVARADAERARSEADAAHAEVERARSAPVEAKPVHEEVSGRLSQILKLAAEEADQERATADAEIAKLRAESKAEAEALLSEARAEAEREVAEARETAERELSEARARAEHDLSAAREEAERLRVVSVRQADELLDEAQRRSGAINEISGQRLETLTATHSEAVLRLGQIRDVLADLLDRDAAAGSLAQVVEAVISPAAVEGELDDHDHDHDHEHDLEPELEPGHELHELPAGDEHDSIGSTVMAEESTELVPVPDDRHDEAEDTAVQSAVTDETREFSAQPDGTVTEVEVVDVRDARDDEPAARPAPLRR